nr:5'-methylthioadenosine/S-adenosylhomocysteine nucleosidase [uncultured Dyadobacter sp.]
MEKKILIVTALSLEFLAVKEYLSDNKLVAHPTTGSMYNSGRYTFNTASVDVLLVETGAGNIRAADETGRAIDFFKPDYTFFVGVAGGIKDVHIGDIVACSKVIGFESGKADVEFKPRFESVPSSYVLEQIAKHVKREGIWKARLPAGSNPDAFIQPVAAGEKVVSSNRSAVYTYLKQYCSDAVAVDMEGIGFLLGARVYHTHAIEVRGISDLLENKEEADASGSQPLAAANAASFTFEMIEQLMINERVTRDIYTSEFKKKLVNELVNLYPQGPEHENIWKRAGGDVSILVNTSSRKSQWYDAVDKLGKGGGGKNITLESLLNEVNEDFPESVTFLFQ